VHAAIQSSKAWRDNLARHKKLMTALTTTLGVHGAATVAHASEWTTSFDHFFDNIQTRNCHDLQLPCSSTDTTDCVTDVQAIELYKAAAWEFSYRFVGTPLVSKVVRLGSGALIGQLLENMIAGTGDEFDSTIAAPEAQDKRIFMYSGHGEC
jgi:2-phosphoxylose phosphatase